MGGRKCHCNSWFTIHNNTLFVKLSTAWYTIFNNEYMDKEVWHSLSWQHKWLRESDYVNIDQWSMAMLLVLLWVEVKYSKWWVVIRTLDQELWLAETRFPFQHRKWGRKATLWASVLWMSIVLQKGFISGQLKCSECRGDICQCRHCRRQCKIFASGVKFSRNNAIYNYKIKV